MTVYVDKLRSYGKTEKWKHDEACHLFADSVEELHQFAERIGMKRSWFQEGRTFPHYDLTRNKRNQAVRRGAQEVEDEFVRDFLLKRKG